ncbi:isocitrate lyase/PEP mutase family protein [Rhizobium tubonense]|uniref:Phosphonomutase n=1 Tax=Rhizobium tubonense TaxID=484088 RepID=A0A2W4CHB8_9HYPH|nr:isocitrate lyase/phosphoenolpyruvate mutase family protein [Rhizobium tubonense]PZM12131.1 phosphonomutase [Rhizobium tubonense]
MEQANKAQEFAKLHKKGSPLILYNIWDAGSARAVAESGAKAIATASWAIAAAHGFSDGEAIPLSLLKEIVKLISQATDLPLTVDFEGGYAVDPAEVAANVSEIIDCGAIGINFEDQVVGGEGIHCIEHQSARIHAIRAMVDKRGVELFINARTDLFLKEKDTSKHAALMDDAILRAAAFAAAGASGFFAPGIVDAGLIQTLCERVTLPVNILTRPTTPDLATMATLGVSRISHGPGPYLSLIEKLKTDASAIYRPAAG